MRVFHKILILLIVTVTLLVLYYAFETEDFGELYISVRSSRINGNATYNQSQRLGLLEISSSMNKSYNISVIANNRTNYYNVWCIFTKVTYNAPLKEKFKTFTYSLVKKSSVDISYHVITDNSSKNVAEDIIGNVRKTTSKLLEVTYYDAGRLAHQLTDIVTAMQPHFSSQPGTYYSDALFFLSLGLHHIAANQSRAAMFDADTKLLADVAELFRHFDSFNNTTLFGVAPELTPVYRHVLYVYRSKHKNTRFGEPFSKGGFPGINSGVMLLHLDHMRNSQKYNELLKPASVDELAAKYHFQGHLGDQDFYTLLAMEHPEMIHLLPCGWNRQLCTWWRDHGYQEVFTAFFRCADTVRLYHGNCNTPMPTS
ncbi:xyloside xylosyltransferase 1 isoform X4 [Bacillus rossius redtenbacheri]|uniref:xyloside xylosyltransferase 1 isoform X4 n=1 Tax=Bacillus rossius redtenbacheri TaxID=93214 RepID=UPI002FDCBAD9